MMSMICKQVYISEEQDVRLKQRVQALGVSEDEFLRHALDVALRDNVSDGEPTDHDARLPRVLDVALGDDVPATPSPERLAALDRLLETADRIAATSSYTGSNPWRREDAYDDERSQRLYRL